MSIKMIVAMGRNREIGFNNGLPWRLPDDMRYFSAKTKGHIVLMGRKTADGFEKPLRDRENWVLTRDPRYYKSGMLAFTSIDDLLETYQGIQEEKDLYIVGGAEIYRQLLDYCGEVYITQVDGDFPEADTWFPFSSLPGYQLSRSVHHPVDGTHEFPFTFDTWTRL